MWRCESCDAPPLVCSARREGLRFRGAGGPARQPAYGVQPPAAAQQRRVLHQLLLLLLLLRWWRKGEEVEEVGDGELPLLLSLVVSEGKGEKINKIERIQINVIKEENWETN